MGSGDREERLCEEDNKKNEQQSNKNQYMLLSEEGLEDNRNNKEKIL